MSDSDDDNIVRYGTQLEPYEEDRTRAMPKTSSHTNSAKTRRFRRLLAANVNVNKARELSKFPWTEICKMIPALKAIAPEIPNPAKKSKKKNDTLQARLQQELTERRSRQEPDQAHYRHKSRDARRTSRDRSRSPNYWQTARYSESSHRTNMDDNIQRPSSHPPHRQTYTKEVSHSSQRIYWEEAGSSQARGYEANQRKRRPSKGEPNWEPPNKVTKDSQVDCERSNSWGRDRSPRTSARQDPIPMSCSSKYYECTQLEYIDPDEALQVKVKNGMRAVKRHYNESNDVKPFPDQPYNAQRTSSEGGASFNYWSEPDRPSRLGLRNETHPPKHASTYSYSEDKKFREDPRNYQKISWENSVNLDYRESDRPSRDGLRNENHPMASICIEDSDEEYRGPIYEPHTPVDEGDVQFNFTEAYRREPKSEKGSQRTQPSEARESFVTKDANENKNAEPIRVGIRNITAMTKTQMTLVHQSINQAIVRIGVQGAGPKFSGSTFKNGWILMLCENHKSRKWLEKKVPILKPWPEASLSVTPGGELLKPITLSILIPDKEGITVATALELLRVQNPGLDTDNWKVFKVTKTYSGQVVLLSVDEASFEALRLISFKANLGIDKVTFWIRSGPGIRGGLVKPSEDVPLSPALCAFTKGQNQDAKSCGIGSLAIKATRKRRRKCRNDRLAEIQTIDIKQEMTEVKESKSPPPETWRPIFDQSYSSSDWITW